MAQLPSVFRAEDNRGSGYEVLPAGWYQVEIIKSALKPTKDKNGKYLAFTFRVVDGEFEKRNLFTNVNVVNNSDVAVAIGKETLAAMMDACEVEETDDTDDLHNIPMYAKVIIKAAQGDWPEKNEIKTFLSDAKYSAMMDKLDDHGGDEIPF